MRKFGIFTATIFLSSLLAGCYGVIHDQITFTISNEYFTKFKYIQFAINPEDFGGHRVSISIIGFLATWWMGMIIGFVLGFVGLLFKDYKLMSRALIASVPIVLFTAVLFGLIGFLYSTFYLVNTEVSWGLPETLVDRKGFVVVGSIHNFSYLGGAIGLLVALVYMIIKLASSSKRFLE